MSSEFEIIQRYFKRPTNDTILGIGDDAAIIAPTAKMELAISTDTLVSGQHFFEDVDPYKLGYKAISVNLSDMAAMGARPRWVTLSLTLPKKLIEYNEVWLSEFARGFHELARMHHVALIGGDTTSGPLNIGVQIIGEIEKGQSLRRDGAKSGDDIWVSGCLGDAALALKFELQKIKLTDKEAELCMSALHMPIARIELGQLLTGLAHSAIDISDGLMADLGHILVSSRSAAIIQLEAVPCSEVLKRFLPSSLAVQCLLAGGDDYELCFTAPKNNRNSIESIAQKLKIPLTMIGEITQGEGLLVMDAEGREITVEKRGYDHFAS
ncbi:thiamine-phosphate kinase [Nitrosomonas aestuarii]|uniref:thiamine-phosphate kinase n=1 Tax=Nitrosomonas aestuarii TaxID=52441 RepID=UPI000D32412B|nr:thiamine-phosphate kinase [Nitrosomonas aestuarii]PTN12907.1 thiamine-phosphate kinase [Nitrosomonas aestuarii]